VVVGRVSGSECRRGFAGEAKSELVDVGKDQASVGAGAWHFEAPLVEFAPFEAQGKRDKQYEQTCGRIACRYG